MAIPQMGIPLDFAGDIVALERLRALYPQDKARPLTLDGLESAILVLINTKAQAQTRVILDSLNADKKVPE